MKKGEIMEDIICPKCEHILEPEDNWDFIDYEEHKVACSCGHKFVVLIERPIEYYILETV